MSSTCKKSSKIGSDKKEYGCKNFYGFCGIESGANAESIFRNFSCRVQILCWSTVVLLLGPIGFALIKCRSCLKVLVKVEATKSETLQNYAVLLRRL